MNLYLPIPSWLYPENLQEFFQKRMLQFIIGMTMSISIFSVLYVLQHNLILLYGDAESHINISKRIISGLTPGFGQLGGVWLPLQHMMMVPFVANDSLWRSGLGGSIVSMISFITATYFLYKIVYLITKSTGASITAALIFISNPNILYAQSTPLGEVPLMVMMIAAVYFIVQWATTENFLYLIFGALFIFLGSLIRYDAWFLIICSLLVIPLIGIIRRYRYHKIESSMILYCSIAFLGMVFWLVWNYLIFKNPVYFMASPYSAKTQQQGWLQKGQLPSFHHVANSFLFYTDAMTKNVGIIFVILALISLVIYIGFALKSKKNMVQLLSLSLILTPYVFYVVTLYMGISIILIPGLLPVKYMNQLFNVRYGIVMLPGVAILVGMLWSKMKTAGRILLYVAIVWQLVFFLFDGTPIIVADGASGLSGRKPNAANTYVARHYDGGFIMFDDYSRTANPVSLNIPMNKIIYVGNHPMWDNALIHPTKYVRWVIIRQDENDSVWNKFKYNNEFIRNYHAVFTSDNVFVYKINS